MFVKTWNAHFKTQRCTRDQELNKRIGREGAVSHELPFTTGVDEQETFVYRTKIPRPAENWQAINDMRQLNCRTKSVVRSTYGIVHHLATDFQSDTRIWGTRLICSTKASTHQRAGQTNVTATYLSHFVIFNW